MPERADSGTSPTLLGRLRHAPGDPAAWNAFVARYGRMVEDWCRHWGLQPADAEDVTQNVLLQLSKQMSRFEYDSSGSFRAWLKTVAYRAWCDYLDQRTRRRDKGSGDSAVLDLLGNVAAREDFLNQTEREWERELLEEAMRVVRGRVQEHTWEAFRLMTQGGLSGAEVADRLSMKPGTVWVAKSKVQKMIREEVRRLDALESAGAVP